MVLTVANVSPDGRADEYRRVITEALSLEVAGAGLRLVAPARWEAARAELGVAAGDLVLGGAALAVARAVGADLAATGLYRFEDNRMVVEIKLYDAAAQRMLAAVVRSGAAGLGVYNLVNEAVLEAAPVLAGWREPASGSPDASPMRMVVLASGDDGADVLVAGRKVASVAQGRAVVPVVSAQEALAVEIRKPGFHSRRQQVRLPAGGDAQALLEPMRAESRWAVEGLWTVGQLAGAGLGGRYYLAPDTLFLAADTYFYVQPPSSGGSPVFHDDLRLLAGRYLFLGPYSPVRLGVGAGVGGIMSILPDSDARARLDLYVSPANVWIEWNRQALSLFLRGEGKYALGSGYLPKGWITVKDGPPPLTLGVVWKW